MTRDMKKFSERRNRRTGGRKPSIDGYSLPPIRPRAPSSAGANQTQPQIPPVASYPVPNVYAGDQLRPEDLNRLARCINDLNERITTIEDTIGLALEE